MLWLIIGAAAVLLVAAPPLLFGRCVECILDRLLEKRK